MTASRRLSAHRAQARSRRPARQFTICVLDATPHADPQFQHLSWLDVTLQATTAGTTPCWSRAPNIGTVPRPPLLGTTEPRFSLPTTRWARAYRPRSARQGQPPRAAGTPARSADTCAPAADQPWSLSVSRPQGPACDLPNFARRLAWA